MYDFLDNLTIRGWVGAFLIVVPITTVMGMFTGGFLGSSVVGAVIGLAVGLLEGLIAVLVSRRESWRTLLANAPVLLAGLVAGVLFGGGLLSQLWMNQAWIASPPSSFELIQPPIGNGLNAFFILFNSLMEWALIPAAIVFNWRIPKRRTLIIAAAVIYYGMRVWTYVYFAPEIMTFYEIPSSGPFSPELAERAQQWVYLSWYRVAIDGLVNLLFFLAAFIPGSSSAEKFPETKDEH
ncbi:MAG: hypothetical protein M3360_06590 [Actinomycetota bacterium]|nr:hypothetical protein [Actinomycetota bacterium]